MSADDKIILYHGSYTSIENIDLSKCNYWKDFGRGFYLTEDYNQAVKFALSKTYSKNNDKGNKYIPCVNVYEFIKNDKIKIHEFESANAAWIKTILGYRKKGDDYKNPFSDADIIIGKIADDGTKVVLQSALDGLYGSLTKQETLNYIITLLEPDKLKKQYCFKNKKSLKLLKKVDSIYIK